MTVLQDLLKAVWITVGGGRWPLRMMRLCGGGLIVLLVACQPRSAPDLASAEWLAFQVRFCTESQPAELWETRDPEKLALLQAAYSQFDSEPLEHVIKSPNHAMFVVVKGEESPQTWQLTLRLDQQTMALFNVKQPEQSFLAHTDPMMYRALNTLLISHMGETVDIFRRCEAENL